MVRLRFFGGILLATLAVSGVLSQIAHAEGPFFSKCTKLENPCKAPIRLKKGESVEITGSSGTIKLATSVQKIECTKNKVKAGAKILGSEPGTAGSSEQIGVFEGCTIKENGEGCAIPGGRIEGVTTVGTLAKENKLATKGEKLLVSFRPKEGAALVTLKFEGAQCKIKETTVELASGAQLGVAAVVDLEKENKGAEGGHEPVKLLENEALQKIMLGDSPKSLIKTEFVEEGKAVKEVKVGWVAFGKAVTEVAGHAQGELVGVEDWGVFGA